MGNQFARPDVLLNAVPEVVRGGLGTLRPVVGAGLADGGLTMILRHISGWTFGNFRPLDLVGLCVEFPG